MQYYFLNNNNIFAEVEKHLSLKLGNEVKIAAVEPVGGGCIHHASKIETNAGNFFLKWNTSSQADIFVREAESLRALKKAAKGALLVPEVFASKKVDELPGFLVIEFLQASPHQSNTDYELGRGLALIHQYKNRFFGFDHDNYCGDTVQNNTAQKNWVDFFRDNRLRFLLKLIEKKQPLPTADQKVYGKLLERIPQLLPATSEPVLIHGDLWSGNYMVTQKGPALVDPASYFADCEMEFAIITMFGGFSQRFFDSYNEVNPLPPDWRDRNRLYQLYHILNHYYLFGGGYRSQALKVATAYL